LPSTKIPRLKGLILINSNDYNLPTDLMFRLIEWKLKKEWKMGYFTSIDFVSCAATIDMYKQNQTPLYARHIIRTEDNPEIKGVRLELNLAQFKLNKSPN